PLQVALPFAANPAAPGGTLEQLAGDCVTNRHARTVLVHEREYRRNRTRRNGRSRRDDNSTAARPSAVERWHCLSAVGLGITWILDGFEVTLVAAIASALTQKDTLHLITRTRRRRQGPGT